MRLHIHFGIHRTGTTTIHRTLNKHKDTLEENGILYPNLGFDSRHVKLAWSLISKKQTYAEAVKQIKAEVKDHTKLIILSSEDFCLLDIEKWLDILSSNFNVSASIYLRRQDIWLESWYNQHIRWPWDKKLSNAKPDVFLKKMSDFHWIDYDKLLTRISSKVERNNLYINTIERGSVQNTTKDLLQYLAVPSIGEISNDNSSFSSAKIDIIRRINLIDVSQEARRRIINALDVLEMVEDNGSKHVFNQKQAKSIMKRFSKSNASVARSFFDRERLFLAPYEQKREPCFISDDKAYKEYIPKLLKLVAQG